MDSSRFRVRGSGSRQVQAQITASGTGSDSATGTAARDATVGVESILAAYMVSSCSFIE